MRSAFLQLVADFLDRLLVAALLALHLQRADLVVVHLGGHAREQVRVADGNAARHPDAVHREGDGG